TPCHQARPAAGDHAPGPLGPQEPGPAAGRLAALAGPHGLGAPAHDPPPRGPGRGCRRHRAGRTPGLAAPEPPPTVVLGPRHPAGPVYPRHRLRGSGRRFDGRSRLTAGTRNRAGQGRGTLHRNLLTSHATAATAAPAITPAIRAAMAAPTLALPRPVR